VDCRHTFLRAVKDDLKPLNVILAVAWKKSTNGGSWRRIVDTATLKT